MDCIFVSTEYKNGIVSEVPYKCQLKEKLGIVDCFGQNCIADTALEEGGHFYRAMIATGCLLYSRTIEEAQKKISSLGVEILLMLKNGKETVENKV